MRRRIGRMIVVVVFLLLVFGFYPTDNIVQAKKGGVPKSDGDWTVFGTDMYSNVTGNVGIGDSEPDGKLEVNPDETEDNGDEFVVDSTGNVGIGTTAPSVKLQVQDGWINSVSGNNILSFRGKQAGSIYGFTDPSIIVAHGSSLQSLAIGTAGASDVAFVTNGTQRLRIEANTGNVGIGTTSPTGIFNVVDASPGGSISTTPLGFKVNKNYDAIVLEGSIVGMTLGSGRSSQGLINFADEDDAAAGFVQYIHLNDRLNLGTGGFTRVHVDSSGNVGIGTSDTSGFKLAVNGSAAKLLGGGSWSFFSDERLKTIHGTFDAGLEEVLKLQPIIYRYNKHNPLNLPDEGEHIGFSAQAVQKVIPEAVSENNEGYLLVNNDPIMWTMLNAIKEQQAQIEQLKAENEQLKETASTLVARQNALETMFLAISTTLPKEKLVKLDHVILDEAQKTIQ